MRKISAFNFITINGFLNGPGGDISWHRHGEEENSFAADSLKSQNTLLFGRKTYEMMASYWPSQMAKENDPTVAEGMNNADKLVISNSLIKVEWENTRIISKDALVEIKKLKSLPGNDITILGSGSIVSQLAENGLIDEYLIMIDPVAIGAGTPIFHGIKQTFNLKLNDSKTFKSGVLLLRYKPF